MLFTLYVLYKFNFGNVDWLFNHGLLALRSRALFSILVLKTYDKVELI